jgi:hypothetical protein
MQPKQIAELIVARCQGNLTLRQGQELNAWIDQSPHNRQFIETRMSDEKITGGVLALLEKDDAGMRKRFVKLLKEKTGIDLGA